MRHFNSLRAVLISYMRCDIGEQDLLKLNSHDEKIFIKMVTTRSLCIPLFTGLCEAEYS